MGQKTRQWGFGEWADLDGWGGRRGYFHDDSNVHFFPSKLSVKREEENKE